MVCTTNDPTRTSLRGVDHPNDIAELPRRLASEPKTVPQSRFFSQPETDQRLRFASPLQNGNFEDHNDLETPLLDRRADYSPDHAGPDDLRETAYLPPSTPLFAPPHVVSPASVASHSITITDELQRPVSTERPTHPSPSAQHSSTYDATYRTPMIPATHQPGIEIGPGSQLTDALQARRELRRIEPPPTPPRRGDGRRAPRRAPKPDVPARQVEVCRRFLRGRCTDSSCRFSHTRATPPATPPTNPPTPTVPAGPPVPPQRVPPHAPSPLAAFFFAGREVDPDAPRIDFSLPPQHEDDIFYFNGRFGDFLAPYNFWWWRVSDHPDTGGHHEFIFYARGTEQRHTVSTCRVDVPYRPLGYTYTTVVDGLNASRNPMSRIINFISNASVDRPVRLELFNIPTHTELKAASGPATDRIANFVSAQIAANPRLVGMINCCDQMARYKDAMRDMRVQTEAYMIYGHRAAAAALYDNLQRRDAGNATLIAKYRGQTPSTDDYRDKFARLAHSVFILIGVLIAMRSLRYWLDKFDYALTNWAVPAVQTLRVDVFEPSEPIILLAVGLFSFWYLSPKTPMTPAALWRDYPVTSAVLEELLAFFCGPTSRLLVMFWEMVHHECDPRSHLLLLLASFLHPCLAFFLHIAIDWRYTPTRNNFLERVIEAHKIPSTAESYTRGYQVLPPCTALPAHHPTSIPPGPEHPKYGPALRKLAAQDHEAPAFLYPICMPVTMPPLSSSDPRALAIALNERVLAQQPAGHNALLEWRCCIDMLVPIFRDVMADTIERFPTLVEAVRKSVNRDILLDGKRRLDLGELFTYHAGYSSDFKHDDMVEKKCFAKVEPLPVKKRGGQSYLKSRLISTLPPHVNAIMAPFQLAMTRLLHATFDGRHHRGVNASIVYAAARAPDDFLRAAANAMEAENWFFASGDDCVVATNLAATPFIEGDYSAYDASQGPALCLLPLWEMMGMSRELTTLIMTCFSSPYRVRSRDVKFTMELPCPQMPSGLMLTTVFNTFVNICTYMYSRITGRSLVDTATALGYNIKAVPRRTFSECMINSHFIIEGRDRSGLHRLGLYPKPSLIRKTMTVSPRTATKQEPRRAQAICCRAAGLTIGPMPREIPFFGQLRHSLLRVSSAVLGDFSLPDVELDAQNRYKWIGCSLGPEHIAPARELVSKLGYSLADVDDFDRFIQDLPGTCVIFDHPILRQMEHDPSTTHGVKDDDQ